MLASSDLGTRRSTTTFGIAAWTAVFVFVGPLFAATAESNVDNGLTVSRLRCQYLVDPAGIDATEPEPELDRHVATPRRDAECLSNPCRLVACEAGHGRRRFVGQRSRRVRRDFRYPLCGPPTQIARTLLLACPHLGRSGPTFAVEQAGNLVRGSPRQRRLERQVDRRRHRERRRSTCRPRRRRLDLDRQRRSRPGERVFYKKWSLPTGVAIKSAWLTAVGGEITSFYINGHEVVQTMFAPEPMHVDVRSQLQARRESLQHDGPPRGRRSCRWLCQTRHHARDRVSNCAYHRRPMARRGRAKGDGRKPRQEGQRQTNMGRWPLRRRTLGHSAGQRLATEPPHYLRKEFSVKGDIKQAVLSVTALGWADVYLNGQRVSDDLFGSGWTEYKKRVYYRTYDVTSLLRQGENAWGADPGRRLV